jgi:hypothetical protein
MVHYLEVQYPTLLYVHPFDMNVFINNQQQIIRSEDLFQGGTTKMKAVMIAAFKKIPFFAFWWLFLDLLDCTTNYKSIFAAAAAVSGYCQCIMQHRAATTATAADFVIIACTRHENGREPRPDSSSSSINMIIIVIIFQHAPCTVSI